MYRNKKPKLIRTAESYQDIENFLKPIIAGEPLPIKKIRTHQPPSVERSQDIEDIKLKINNNSPLPKCDNSPSIGVKSPL